ncbi:tol-pal system protein YbgF [Orbus sturtevantii]|uniref:tol-pal system protein YbgF n=1 Tax=Orbus sturtevantii TaxID=3074109 RepID=UPI00370D555B
MYKKIILLFVLSLPFYSYADSELERIVEAQGQLLTDSQQKISNLQDEVDQLRGQLEQTAYQLNQTIERQKTILQQLNNQAPVQQNVTANNSSTLSGWSASGNDKDDYNFIIKFVMSGKEPKDSITALQQFLKDYPKSTYSANVNYWLGQLCYNQGRKDDASFYYATVVKNFPKSPKAADSLYKVGLILLEKGDKVKAKAVFKQVINQYPNDKKTIASANSKLATLG